MIVRDNDSVMLIGHDRKNNRFLEKGRGAYRNFLSWGAPKPPSLSCRRHKLRSCRSFGVKCSRFRFAALGGTVLTSIPASHFFPHSRRPRGLFDRSAHSLTLCAPGSATVSVVKCCCGNCDAGPLGLSVMRRCIARRIQSRASRLRLALGPRLAALAGVQHARRGVCMASGHTRSRARLRRARRVQCTRKKWSCFMTSSAEKNLRSHAARLLLALGGQRAVELDAIEARRTASWSPS